MKEDLEYRPLDNLSEESIQAILNGDNLGDIIRLPLSVGMNHPNWKYAQDLCIKLAESNDLRIRTNALRGLGYVAMTKGKLEKHLVKPLLINALKSEHKEELDIVDIVIMINRDLKWNIGNLGRKRRVRLS